jgi:DNA invertase Pin-like site-specific DNA recombinase
MKMIKVRIDTAADKFQLRHLPGYLTIGTGVTQFASRYKTAGMDACLKALRCDDTLVIWKLDRLGRDLHHLVNTVGDLTKRGIGLKVLAGEGASIDTTTANGRLIFAIFAGLAEFERELIVERTRDRHHSIDRFSPT